MDLGITNRLALVTGSSRGIGKGIASKLAHEGARVILVARSADVLEAVRRDLPGSEKHHAFAIDLTAQGGVEKLAESVAKLGDLDIVIHNLGGSGGVRDAFSTAEDWKRIWHLNVGIGLELNRLLVPGMIQRRWGRIVHLSTLSTSTYSGAAPYVSAKCALEGYVKCVSREVSRHNVIVSAVAPGAIALEGRYFDKIQKENSQAAEDYFKQHLPIQRFGTADDVAASVAFLCSEQASYLAGTVVAVDGGWN